jgi:hypothetical protein
MPVGGYATSNDRRHFFDFGHAVVSPPPCTQGAALNLSIGRGKKVKGRKPSLIHEILEGWPLDKAVEDLV